MITARVRAGMIRLNRCPVDLAKAVDRAWTSCNNRPRADGAPESTVRELEQAVDRAFAAVFGIEADSQTLRELMVSLSGGSPLALKALATLLSLRDESDGLAKQVFERATITSAAGSRSENTAENVLPSTLMQTRPALHFTDNCSVGYPFAPAPIYRTSFSAPIPIESTLSTPPCADVFSGAMTMQETGSH